jgi:hypothetical protein
MILIALLILVIFFLSFMSEAKPNHPVYPRSPWNKPAQPLPVLGHEPKTPIPSPELVAPLTLCHIHY